MAKVIISFVCSECGYDSPRFLGKCPECGGWNTLKEFSSKGRLASSRKSLAPAISSSEPKKLSDIFYQEKKRLLTGFSELDMVLGGGIVKGSVTLIAGDPGIGKSTLLLQTAIHLSKTGTILYVSAEESQEQIKLRSIRISSNIPPGLLVLSSTNIDEIIDHITSLSPLLVVVDSIQTVESENMDGLTGSVPQVRYSALQLIQCAKTLNIPVILVGHVTKEGFVAGPMMLSHMVDTVLFLEGDKFMQMRLLRSFKNRFGPVDEVGIFSMGEKGLLQVDSPYVLFSHQTKPVAGSSYVVTIEGTRPFVVEIQSLVVSSKFSLPKRVSSGIDSRRLELLLAVLQKHCKLPLDTMDVFVNVAGGLRISDPASDLGICLVILSSVYNAPLSVIGIAEVGLLGELRVVADLDKRIKEARKRGLTKIISPKTHTTIRDVVSSQFITRKNTYGST